MKPSTYIAGSNAGESHHRVNSVHSISGESADLAALERRLGRRYVTQRLGLERDHEAEVCRKGRYSFSMNLEDPYSVLVIRKLLQVSGLYARGKRNALSIDVKWHEVLMENLPPNFEGFTILQLSDLHIDMSAGLLEVLINAIGPLDYDVCVLTGDYRARTFGSYDAALEGMKRLQPHIRTAAYAILGNHDTIRMVPAMEAIGYRFLINEHVKIQRGSNEVHLAGIDDAHLYRLADCDRAAHDIPRHSCAILLSHTPEAYRDAAHAGFDLMLCGHTHGGQICLPGGIPVLTEAASPRRFARGPWRYDKMIGYTSVGVGTCLVEVRLNCRPEVTLHRLGRPRNEATA
jgi:predicted MPP superfamily phosphohydrolase